MDKVNTKEALIPLLLEKGRAYLSGEEAAAALGISRAAVWKGIEALRQQGFAVDSAPGGGYRLAAGEDALCQAAIRHFLPDKTTPMRYYDEVDSTNIAGKRWAIEGAAHGSLLVARRQTAGRGRLGRSFESPPGGLYLSVVLRPHKGAEAVMITAAAAVVVCRAVSGLCGLELEIKWVNDLYYKGKKCCGILTEAGTGVESGSIEYMVVGIGVNYTTPPGAFADAGKEVAVSLFPGGGQPPVGRAQLAAAIHTELMQAFETLGERTFLPEYRQRSMVLGRPVTVLTAEPYAARAVAIDDDARLLVEPLEGGAQVALSYGEISVRL